MVERLLDHELLGSPSSGFFFETPCPWAEVDKAPESGAQEPSGQALWRECRWQHSRTGDPERLAQVPTRTQQLDGVGGGGVGWQWWQQPQV